jgi:hypothetical protein
MAALGYSESKLAEELRKRGFIGTTQPSINRIKRGNGTASLALALEIEDVLEGKVRAEELPVSPRSRIALKGIRRRAMKA